MTTFSLRPFVQLLLAVTFLAFVPYAFAAEVSQEVSETSRLSQAEREALLKQTLAVGEEWFGLYVLGQKAGAMSTNTRQGEHEGSPALFVSHSMNMRASIAGRDVQREVKGERIYELSGEGRLIAFSEERIGDGGDEKFTGRCTPDGVALVRQAKDKKPQTLRLPATRENLDAVLNAAQVLETGKPVTYVVFDLEKHMADKRVTMSLMGRRTEMIAGVEVQVSEIAVTEEDSRIAQTALVTPDGRTLEIRYGNVLTVKAEPRETAESQGRIDVFGSTRIVLGGKFSLSQRLTAQAREAPSKIVYAIEGLPRSYWVAGTGQTFTPVDDAEERVELTVVAALPKKKLKLPIAPETIQKQKLGDWLKPTLAVESEAPQIVSLTKKTIGKTTDAFETVEKLSNFVYRFLKKSYGVSSDRATRVLEMKEGDCTEHALLFTTMARAAGIPARRVNGLVYMDATDGIPALYWHEWAEVFVGEWIPVDPTFGQSVADAGHLAFGVEGQNDVAALFGQLRIKVKEVSKPGGKTSAPKK